VQTYRSKARDRGSVRARHLATVFGRELRIARTTAGLTQRQLGRLAGVTQQAVSLAEAGVAEVTLAARCRMAAACGTELGWRLYPTATVRLRDSGQLAIAQTIVSEAHPAWHPRLEVPIAAGDLRAADLILASADEVVHVEIERFLVDAQAQIRAAQVKRAAFAERDVRPVRLVLALPDTRSIRAQIASIRGILETAFPTSSRRTWVCLRAGTPIGADGLLLVASASPMSRDGTSVTGAKTGYTR
jgi:transcriptional regulator with XRE-family HTH domain